MNFIKNFLESVFSIFFICLIQVSILNPLFFLGGYTYLYIIFILIYSSHENRFMFLFLSFMIGWIIDHCMNSGGIHAFSTTLSAFFRLKIIQFFEGKNFFKKSNFSIYELPFIRKCLYIFSLIFTHHFSLFILEILKLSYFSKIILMRIIFSSIFTTILCIIYFFFRRIKH